VSTTDPAEGDPRDGVAVVLLRGINVGRNRRIKMADLREALTAAGFERVRTLLQSGNVVLDAPGVPQEEVERRVHDAVLEFSGFDVAVLARTAAELRAVVEHSPMPDPPDGSRYLVAFLAGSADDVELPQLPDGSEEQWWRSGREIYAWCPGGLLESPLMEHFGARRATVPATVRNWNTVVALARLTTE
jgi:uncharacterized protein (DUF1697 family)